MKDKQISVNRSVFTTLIIVLVLLVIAFVYLYGNKTNDFKKTDISKNVKLNAEQSVELQAGVFSLVADSLTEAQEELDSINLDSLK
jgi:nitric oxide reductase large subunit